MRYNKTNYLSYCPAYVRHDSYFNQWRTIETVSKLGDSKLTTTQIYAKVVESKLADDMFMLRQKLK